MFGLGAGELLLIFVIALIVFGPRKLPELGKALGRGLTEFKKASSELRSSLEEEIRVEREQEDQDRQQATAPRPLEAVPPANPATDHGTEESTVRPADPRS